MNVVELARMGPVAGRDHLLDHQQLRRFCHRPPAAPEYFNGLIVIKVMQYGGEDVRIGAGRNRREEISPDELAAPGNPGGFQALTRARNDRRAVEEDTPHHGMCCQDGGQQPPRPPPTSTTVCIPAKSYVATRPFVRIQPLLLIAALKIGSSSGCRAR